MKTIFYMNFRIIQLNIKEGGGTKVCLIKKLSLSWGGVLFYQNRYILIEDYIEKYEFIFQFN